jgi:hypothetical protein
MAPQPYRFPRVNKMYVDASALLVNYVNSGLIDGFFLHNTKLTLLSMTKSKGLSQN